MYVFAMILSDWQHVKNYPGCYRELDDLYSKDGWPFFNVTLEKHHLITTIFDVVLNLFISTDSVLALYFAPTFCYLINYDLLLYWSSLQTKLQWRS